MGSWVCHVNIRSLSRNFDSLSLFLSSLNIQASILGITETWFSETSPQSMCNLENYEFVNNNRCNRRGGGTGIFIRSDISFKRRLDLDINTSYVESTFIETVCTKSKIVIGVIYRPPDQPTKEFYESLCNIFQIVNNEKKILYLLGDFNINILKVGKVQSVSDFLEILMLHSMFPHVQYPTRVTENSISLIDNIISNDSCESHAGVILSEISDHFPVYCICDNDTKYSDNITFERRNINNENIFKFMRLLELQQWQLSENSADKSYNDFLCDFINIYESCFPIESICYKYKRKDKPWFTNDIRKLSKKKNRLYKLYVKNPTVYRKKVYNKCRNKVNSMIKSAKTAYYGDQFKENKGNLKKTWNVINNALGKKRKNTDIKKVQYDNKAITDNVEICDVLNEYFVNVGYNLNLSFSSCNNDFKKYIKRNIHTAYFKPISSNEIINVVEKLKSNSSAGYDGIDIKVIKKIIHLISEHLSAIFNQCLECGEFPTALKIAKVTPIFKSGSTEILSNYRPISVLPVFSKILEKCIYNRLLEFIIKCNILNTNQYGFREGHSTSSALIDFIHKVVSAIDKGETMLGLFLDLRKAFDTLDHDIMIEKLQMLGIRGTILNLFKSYLSNRKQMVIMNKSKSQLKHIRCGVPQGSILGPLLFLLYINDIVHASNILKFILFADDTSIFLSHKNIHTLQSNFNNEIKLIFQWFNSNKLTINEKKTNFIIFTKKTFNKESISIKIGESAIQRVSSTKFLGVVIDEKLSWANHVDIICNKLCKSIGVMYKLKSLPTSILRMIYYAIMYPYLHYAITVWGNCALVHQERLFKLQKRAIRIINHESFLAHTSPMFYSCNMLQYRDIYIYETGVFMYLCQNHYLPEYLLNLFIFNSDVHSYNTRSAAHFHLPNVRTSVNQKSIIFQGPFLWNSIPTEIKNSCSLNVFKRRYKRFLLDRLNV